MQTAMVLGVYAALLVIGGIFAYSSAPEGANAKTALIVPGACAAISLVCALLASARPLHIARIGWYAGIVCTLLFAVAFGVRAWGTTGKAARYAEALGAYSTAQATDPSLAEPGRRAAFFRDRNAPDHDPTYLRNTLWALCGISVATCVTLATLRRPLAPTAAARPIPRVLQSDEHPMGTPMDPGPLPPEQRL